MWEHVGALKPPFWLLSLPLFIVLYRNTATSPHGDDKRVDGEGDGNGNGDGNGDGDSDGGGDEKPDDGDAKDKREYGEGKQQI